MSYGKLSISQVRKVTKGGIAATSRHNMRTDFEHWSTEHVDPQRHTFNRLLIGKNTADDIYEDIAGCDMRRNTKKNDNDNVIAAEIIIAPSKQWLAQLIGESEFVCTVETCQKLRHNIDFQRWLFKTKAALEEERCINAILHMDETTPHVHAILSVKMKRESKSKSEKTKKRSKKSEYVLSYSNFYGTRGQDYCLAKAKGEKRAKLEKKYGKEYDSTRTPTGQLQTRLWEKIGKPFEMERGEAASETGIKGKSVKEWRIEQAKAKIDQEVAEEVSKYSEEKKSEVTLKKQEIEKKYENEVLSLVEVKKIYVQNQITKINNQGKEEVKNFEKQVKQHVEERCRSINSRIETTISSFIDKKTAESKKRVEEFEEKKKKEELEELERIKRNNNQRIEYLRKKDEELSIATNELAEEKEKLRESFNKLAAKQHEENIRLENEINSLHERYGEKIEVFKKTISIYVDKLAELCKEFGYIVKKTDVLSLLTTHKKQINADARFKIGLQVNATRRATEKKIDKVLNLADDVDKMTDVINNFRP